MTQRRAAISNDRLTIGWHAQCTGYLGAISQADSECARVHGKQCRCATKMTGGSRACMDTQRKVTSTARKTHGLVPTKSLTTVSVQVHRFRTASDHLRLININVGSTRQMLSQEELTHVVVSFAGTGFVDVPLDLTACVSDAGGVDRYPHLERNEECKRDCGRTSTGSNEERSPPAVRRNICRRSSHQ